jgi:hypothetical protein
MAFLRTVQVRFATLSELMALLWERKLWWLIPLATVLVLLIVLLIIAQATGAGRLMYPVF